MHPVPSNFDLSPFVGRQLNQACIGPHDLLLNFNGVGSFSCTGGEVWVVVNGESRLVFDREGWGDVASLPLTVGRDVVTWSIDGTHDFSLSLSGAAIIRFRSEDSPYEDFVVSTPGGIWVI